MGVTATEGGSEAVKKNPCFTLSGSFDFCQQKLSPKLHHHLISQAVYQELSEFIAGICGETVISLYKTLQIERADSPIYQWLFTKLMVSHTRKA